MLLASEIAIYDEASPGSEDRSHEFLTKVVRRILEKNRQEKNRKDIVKSLETMNDSSKGSINAIKGGKSKGEGRKGAKGKGQGEGGKGKGKTGMPPRSSMLVQSPSYIRLGAQQKSWGESQS